MVKFSYASGFNIYKKSPQYMQDIIGTLLKPLPRSLMLGRGFHEKLQFLAQSEKWNYGQLVEFQEKKLRHLVQHAYKNVPYYHEIFRINDLHPMNIRKIDDLKKLQILTKENIRSNTSKLTAVNYKEFKPGLAYTSGSTGKRLEFYLDQQNREIEYASIWRQAFWSGIRDTNVKIATFRGDLVFEYGKTNKLYKYHGLSKELVFNTYTLDKESIKIMVEKLNEYQPEIIKGFPHSLYIIARYIDEQDIELKIRPSIIQTSSEQLTLQMSEKIEQAFCSKIFDWYSQSEYVISIGQCEKGMYHQIMETGILEVAEDEYGYERIYGTGLWNYSMPFIKYEVGDIIKIGKGCECKRDLLTIESLEGRIDDMIITSCGNVISGAGFDHYWKHRILNRLKEIPEYVHFLQEKTDKIVIDIYSENLFNDDENIIVEELKLLFGNNTEFIFRYLDKLPITKKWRFVESKVKI